MADKLMLIQKRMRHKITPSVDYNQYMKRLDIQLNEPTNQNSIKVSKDVNQTNRKMLLQKFGDYCNIQLNVPFHPEKALLWKIQYITKLSTKIISIYKRGNYIYRHYGCTLIYRLYSYPLRSPQTIKIESPKLIQKYL